MKRSVPYENSAKLPKSVKKVVESWVNEVGGTQAVALEVARTTLNARRTRNVGDCSDKRDSEDVLENLIATKAGGEAGSKVQDLVEGVENAASKRRSRNRN